VGPSGRSVSTPVGGDYDRLIANCKSLLCRKDLHAPVTLPRPLPPLIGSNGTTGRHTWQGVELGSGFGLSRPHQQVEASLSLAPSLEGQETSLTIHDTQRPKSWGFSHSFEVVGSAMITVPAGQKINILSPTNALGLYENP